MLNCYYKSNLLCIGIPPLPWLNWLGIVGCIPLPILGIIFIIPGPPTPLPGPDNPWGACEVVPIVVPRPIGWVLPCPTFGMSLKRFD